VRFIELFGKLQILWKTLILFSQNLYRLLSPNYKTFIFRLEHILRKTTIFAVGLTVVSITKRDVFFCITLSMSFVLET